MTRIFSCSLAVCDLLHNSLGVFLFTAVDDHWLELTQRWDETLLLSLWNSFVCVWLVDSFGVTTFAQLCEMPAVILSGSKTYSKCLLHTHTHTQSFVASRYSMSTMSRPLTPNKETLIIESNSSLESLQLFLLVCCNELIAFTSDLTHNWLSDHFDSHPVCFPDVCSHGNAELCLCESQESDCWQTCWKVHIHRSVPGPTNPTFTKPAECWVARACTPVRAAFPPKLPVSTPPVTAVTILLMTLPSAL